MDKIVQIENHIIGPGHPCFIAAEIGLNHNGDMDLAKRTIQAAAEAGADAVKFQNYRTEDFISDRTLMYEYISEGKSCIESQYDMFKRYELDRDKLAELKKYCDEAGVIFHSTPTSANGIEDLVAVDVTLLKNGSDYLVNLPLIEAMGKSNLPTVLSTGMATLGEIDDAVSTFRSTGNQKLILLHCISSYPTPAEDVHLRKIPALAGAFGCLVGFSDHTWGITAAVGAVALGACYLEKHFTLDKNLPGPDHRFSSDPKELKVLIDAIRFMETCLGGSSIHPTASEELGRVSFRLSCVAATDLQKGQIVSSGDVAFRRPGTGLPPKLSTLLVGNVLTKDVARGHILSMSDFTSID